MKIKPIKILILILFTTILSAHPHCFIDVYPTMDKKSITIKWIFDEMSSQMLIMDFDKNHDGKINKKESQYIYKEAFKVLKEYDYYTYFLNNKKKISTPNAYDFHASIENFRFMYSFKIKVNKKVTNIQFCDEDMFTAFVIKKDFIKIGNTNKKITLKEMDNDYFYGYELELK